MIKDTFDPEDRPMRQSPHVPDFFLRLNSANRPSRELDVSIYLYTHPGEWVETAYNSSTKRWRKVDARGNPIRVPSYTSSLRLAMGLFLERPVTKFPDALTACQAAMWQRWNAIPPQDLPVDMVAKLSAEEAEKCRVRRLDIAHMNAQLAGPDVRYPFWWEHYGEAPRFYP